MGSDQSKPAKEIFAIVYERRNQEEKEQHRKDKIAAAYVDTILKRCKKQVQASTSTIAQCVVDMETQWVPLSQEIIQNLDKQDFHCEISNNKLCIRERFCNFP
jgi:hypothetical protein